VVDAPARILVVDDEGPIRQAVRVACEAAGYAVSEAKDGDEALAALTAFRPDLVLLDLMLPDVSGFDICRDLRRAGSRVPIIILSAKSDEIDVVVGLEIGADDYILKPFRPRELLARVSAHLRKAREGGGSEAEEELLSFKGLTIDVGARRVYRDQLEVTLTHTEFDLLTCLAASAGKVLSRDSILRTVWGYHRPLETRVIDVHVRNLRRKMEPDPARPTYIHAVPGIGYRFATVRA